MADSAALREEAERLRSFAKGITDGDVLAQLQALIMELERRATLQENGSSRH